MPASARTTSQPVERVIELSAFVAAPLAGMTLARLGCDVVRIDPPGGGLDFGRWPVTPLGESLFWAGLNRGKRSVVIDFRRPEGLELVVALILAGASGGEAGGPRGGVLLTNLGAPGPLRYSSLRRSRPDVIAVEVEGYPDGRSAVDYTVAAGSGVPLLTGPEGHVGPVNSPLPTWDIATGLTAAIFARETIWRRQQTGSGARARIALADVALDLLHSLGFVEEVTLAAQPRKRDGNYLYGAFGRDFELADGNRVMVVAITPKQWRSLVDALGISEDIKRIEARYGLDLNREGDRWHARHEVADLVETWCSNRKLDEVAEVFDAHGVCWGEYGTASAVLSRFASDHLGDKGLPVRFEEDLAASFGPAPRLGEHTEEVLTEVLGLGQYEIGKLRDDNVIFAAGIASGDERSA